MSNGNIRLIAFGLVAIAGSIATIGPDKAVGEVILICSLLLFTIQLAPTLLGWHLWVDVKENDHKWQKCNYDLTGNTSGICPECGERI